MPNPELSTNVPQEAWQPPVTEIGPKQKWEKVASEIEKADPPVEEGIKETVIALNAFGLPTSHSCEGHLEKPGWEFPYVDVTADGQPEYRFVGQKERIQKIKEDAGINTLEKELAWDELQRDKDILAAIDEVRRKLPPKGTISDQERRRIIEDGWRAAVEPRLKKYHVSPDDYRIISRASREARGVLYQDDIEFSKNGEAADMQETPEYLEWREKNKQLEGKAQQLLSEFYKAHKAPARFRLGTYDYGNGVFFVASKQRAEHFEGSLSSSQRRNLIKVLPQHQKEMQTFGKFLCRKAEEGEQ